MAMAVTYTNFGGQLVHENRGGVETSFVPDTLGSVMMCRDANGNTTYEAEYWPYGEVRTKTGTNPSPWGFVGTLGYYTDEKSKSVYVRARTLLPNYARWATVDLLWPEEEPYSYGRAAPSEHADPSGLFSWHYVDCGTNAKRRIHDAFQALQDADWQAFLECVSCAEACGYKTNLVGLDEFLDQLRSNTNAGSPSFEVSCLAPGYWPFTNKCNRNDVCAFTNPLSHPPRIHICDPRGFDRTRCGELKCALAHEMIHLWGLPHGNAEREKIFHCVLKIPGCENFRAQSQGHQGK